MGSRPAPTISEPAPIGADPSRNTVMDRPPGALPARQAAALAAVIGQYRPTITTVAEAIGASRGHTHSLLVLLRQQGLVTWTEGAHGTLHHQVAISPVAPQKSAKLGGWKRTLAV